MKKNAPPYATWISIALDDIASAKTLYAQGYYRNAYFLFQQASEKANKAMWLIAGEIEEQKLDDLKHDQFKMYRKMTEKRMDHATTYKRLSAQYPEPKGKEFIPPERLDTYIQSLQAGRSFIDGSRNRDLSNYSLSELTVAHKELLKIENFQIKIPKTIDRSITTVYKNIAAWVGSFQTEEARTAEIEIRKFLKDPETRKQLKDELIKAVHIITDWAFIEYTFSVCAALTVQHSSKTRYPEHGTNPLKTYNAKLPIVKRQPLFMDGLERALKRMTEISVP